MISVLLRIVGVLLIYGGLLLSLAARFQLGQNWSPKPKAVKLVTVGLYKKIQHPMYVFHLVATLGVVCIFESRWLLVLPLSEFLIQAYRARLESKVLAAKFGNTYYQYKSGTWF